MVSIINSISCQSTLSSTSPWHIADRIDFLFQIIFLCFWFLPRSFQPFHKFLGSLSKNRTLPRSSSTTTAAAAADQPADHCEAFPNLSGIGLDWLQF